MINREANRPRTVRDDWWPGDRVDYGALVLLVLPDGLALHEACGCVYKWVDAPAEPPEITRLCF